MVKEITAYQGADGKLYTDKAEAERVDFVFALNDDIAKFLKSEGKEDPDGNVKRLIFRWESWKGGDLFGSLNMPPVAITPAATPAPPLAVKSVPVAATPALRPYRPKVAVVGVWPSHQEDLRKEFGSSLDLNIYSADDINKLRGLKEYRKVLIVDKFTSRRHLDALRAVGQEPLRITGGMAQLKVALQNLVPEV